MVMGQLGIGSECDVESDNDSNFILLNDLLDPQRLRRLQESAGLLYSNTKATTTDCRLGSSLVCGEPAQRELFLPDRTLNGPAS